MALHPALPAAFREYKAIRDRRIRTFLRRNPGARVPPELLLHWRKGRLIPYGEGGANQWMRIIERRLALQGIFVKMSSHMLRRSGATLLEKTLLRSRNASRDGVYRCVQEFLRHENLATTMRYLETDPSRQRRAMETFGSALDWSGRTSGSGRHGRRETLRARRPRRISTPVR
jgi:integrase